LKRRISISVILTLTALTLAVIAVVGFGFREFGIKSAVDKAKTTAELVREGLTVHMINSVMDKRHYFLERIGSFNDVEQLWVVRAQSVIEQYGNGFEGEQSKDDVDLAVLKMGKSLNEVSETSDAVHMRVTIPYVATPECLQCHLGGRGDVLGAVSMVMNISDMRESGLKTIAKVCIISLLILIGAVWTTNLWLNRYLALFEALTQAIKKGHDGDFSPQIKTSVPEESAELAENLNSLYSLLRDTVERIDKKITILIGGSAHNANKNPLIRASDIVDSLVDIYKFKKTVEIDRNKNEIYEHLISKFRSVIGKENDLALFEISTLKNKVQLFYSTNSELYCSAYSGSKLCDECRALRSQTPIFSDDFSGSCKYFKRKEPKNLFFCLPYRITDEFSLLFHIVVKDPSKMERIKEDLTMLNNYLEAARPVLESRYLTHALQESNLHDGLTGLYNRKFLDEFIDHIARQASRTRSPYALLALDIDHFKMVNDTYGHDIGDIVIKGLAETMTTSIREADVAIRQGGEEFLIMLFNTTEEGAILVAEKIRERFAARSFAAGSDSFKKTVSIGIALYPQDGDGMWLAIKMSDIALYRAKTTGRNRVVRFTRDMAPESEAY
jgi:diguanylate cyclase (GGDEF)-like protein